jgi:hypothetical protein
VWGDVSASIQHIISEWRASASHLTDFFQSDDHFVVSRLFALPDGGPDKLGSGNNHWAEHVGSAENLRNVYPCHAIETRKAICLWGLDYEVYVFELWSDFDEHQG